MRTPRGAFRISSRIPGTLADERTSLGYEATAAAFSKLIMSTRRGRRDPAEKSAISWITKMLHMRNNNRNERGVTEI